MCIHNEGKQQFLSLGRLDRKDVRKKMDEVYKEAKPKEYVEKVDKCTFSDLIELWYLDVVVPRLPKAKIRMSLSCPSIPFGTIEMHEHKLGS